MNVGTQNKVLNESLILNDAFLEALYANEGST